MFPFEVCIRFRNGGTGLQVESSDQTQFASNWQGQIRQLRCSFCHDPVPSNFMILLFFFFLSSFLLSFLMLGRSQPLLDDFEHARYYTSQPSPLRQFSKPEHSPKGRIKSAAGSTCGLLWAIFFR